MQEIWNRIESWLTLQAPSVLNSLQFGASEKEIKQAEEILKITFPEEVKQSFRLHNGQHNGTGAFFPDRLLSEELNDIIPTISSGSYFLSLQNILLKWSDWMKLQQVGEAEWNRFWVPFTCDEGGNHDCLDLDPNIGNQSGRIIRVCHETISDIASGPEFEITDNFAIWLERFTIDLESGVYEYAEEYSRLIDADMLKCFRAYEPIRELKIQEALRKLEN